MAHERASLGEKAVDFFLRYYGWFMAVVLGLTLLLGYSVRFLQVDNTLKGTSISDSPACRYYQEFLDQFGDDEFLLVVLFNRTDVYDPAVLKSVADITREVEELEKIDSVRSIATIKTVRMRKGALTRPALMTTDAENGLTLPPPDDLKTILAAMPKTDLLLSPDRKAAGILVQIDSDARFDPKIGKLVDKVRAVVEKHLPPGSSYRLTGQPVIRDAFLRYNLRTAVTLSLLGTAIGWVVSIYVFRSLKISLIPLMVSSVSLVWVTGLMSVLGLRLSTATSMAFGLVIVITTGTVVHIVSHFARHFRDVGNSQEAARRALLTVGEPALICTLTTSAGFASIAVSELSMIQQLGIIMSLGVFLTYVLAVIITPSMLLVMGPPASYRAERHDAIASTSDGVRKFVQAHYRYCFLIGVGVQVCLIAVIPSIQREVRLTSLFKESVPEIQDIRFIERNLAPVTSVELVLDGEEGAFAKPEILQAVREMETRLRQVPAVVRVDSLTAWLAYLAPALSGKDAATNDPLEDAALVHDSLAVTNLNPDGKKMLTGFVNRERSRMHLSARVTDSRSRSLTDLIDSVRVVAIEALGGKAKVNVTGELVIRDDVSGGLIRLQVMSLTMAVGVITVLLMIQFRSITVGLVSLIPNFMPILVVFGIMGWFGIPIDSVTVFAASFSIGLAVDSTIHFLTQVRRAIRNGRTVEQSVGIAFQITGRAIMAGAVILVFGFASLLFSPFRSVANGGILCSASMVGAVIGDLVFMPAVILTFPFIRRALSKGLTRGESDVKGT